MPGKNLVLAAGWDARREPIEQCADKVVRMLSELSAFDQTLATWYEQVRSREQALTRPVKI